MRHRVLPLVLAVLSFSASCATGSKTAPTAAAAPVPSASATCFSGQVLTSSPDGTTPFGPPKAGLASRTWDPATSTITEKVLDDGKVRTATMTREGTSNVFNAKDVEGSFQGTITFSGPEGAWDHWTYALTMTDGSGRVEGNGTLLNGELKTEKYFVTPDGTRRVRIVDQLKTIPAAEYDALLAAALGAPTH